MVHDEPYIHPMGIVEEGARVGARTRVWCFTHILGGAVIGEDCNICDHTFIEADVVVGDRVTVKSGVYLWDGLRVDDDVFIGPSVVFTNDLRPRSRMRPARGFFGTRLCRGCTLGAGSIVLPGRSIGAWAMVGAGSVITRDVPGHALVYGNPARHRGWICRCGESLEESLLCQCGRRYRMTPEATLAERS